MSPPTSQEIRMVHVRRLYFLLPLLFASYRQGHVTALKKIKQYKIISDHWDIALISQLSITEGQVADFLEELAAFLEVHLAQLDAVSRNGSYKRNLKR